MLRHEGTALRLCMGMGLWCTRVGASGVNRHDQLHLIMWVWALCKVVDFMWTTIVLLTHTAAEHVKTKCLPIGKSVSIVAIIYKAFHQKIAISTFLKVFLIKSTVFPLGLSYIPNQYYMYVLSQLH